MDPKDLLERAQAHGAAGEHDAALALLAHQAAQSDHWIWPHLVGQELRDARRPEEAIPHFMQAYERSGEARCAASIGCALVDLGRDEAAHHWFQTSLDVDINEVALLGLALIHLRAGGHADARRFAECGTALYETNDELWATLGEVHFGLGDLDASLAAFDRSLELEPSRMDVLYRAVFITHDASMWRRCARYAIRWMRAEPNEKQARNALVVCLDNLGRRTCVKALLSGQP